MIGMYPGLMQMGKHMEQFIQEHVQVDVHRSKCLDNNHISQFSLSLLGDGSSWPVRFYFKQDGLGWERQNYQMQQGSVNLF